MLKFTKGDMFKSNAEALVNPVNCIGNSGAGLALKFKEKYPAMEAKYKYLCENKKLKLGKPKIFKNGQDPKYIIMFPTKHNWRNKSHLDNIKTGLKELKKIIKKKKIKSIAIPALGAGYGGLNWQDVKQAIQTELSNFEQSKKTVLIYEPL